MKRSICILLSFAIVFSFLPAASANNSLEGYYTVKVEYSDNLGQLDNLTLMIKDDHVFVDAKAIAQRLGYQYKEGESAIAVYNPDSTENLPRKVIVFNFDSTQVSNLVFDRMIDSYCAPFETIKNSSGTWIPFEYSLLLMNSGLMILDDKIRIDLPAKSITDLFFDIAKNMQRFQFDYADDFGHSGLDIKVLAGSSRLINVFNGLLTMDGDSWLVLFQQLLLGSTDAYDKKYAEDIAVLLCTESDKELSATIESVEVAIDLLSEDGALGTILSRMDAAMDADVGILYEQCEKLLKKISEGNALSVTYNRTYQALEKALDKQTWFSETGGVILQVQKQNSALVPSGTLKVAKKMMEIYSYVREFQNQDTFAVGALSHYLNVNGFDQTILNTMKAEMSDYCAAVSGDLASYTESRFLDNAAQWIIDEIPIDKALGTQASIVLFAWNLASTFLPLVRDGLSSADCFDLSMYSQIIQSDAFLTYNAERNKTFSNTSSITAENLFKVVQCCFIYLKACYVTREAALNSLNGKPDSVLSRIQPLIDYQNQINEAIAQLLVEMKRADTTNKNNVYGFLPTDNSGYLNGYTDNKLIHFITSYGQENNDETDNTDFQDPSLVLDAYSVDLDSTKNGQLKLYTYRIPMVNLDSTEIAALNQRIYDLWYPDIVNARTEIREYGYPILTDLRYNWNVQKGILCLHIHAGLYTDPPESEFVYNVLLDSARPATSAEVLAAYGMDEGVYPELVRQALGSAFLDFSYDNPDRDYLGDYYLDFFRQTLSDENLSNTVPFIHENGRLYILGQYFYPVGGGSIACVIDLENFELSPHYEEMLAKINAPAAEQITFTMENEYYEFKSEDGTLCYTLTLDYPVFRGDNPLVGEINASIESMLDQYKDLDIDAEAIRNDQSIFGGPPSLPYYDKLIIEAACPGNYVSLVETAVFWSGGMHPYSETGGEVYDAVTGQKVSDYSAFFAPGTDMETLVEKYGETGLHTQNCQSFYLSEDGVVLIFWVGDAFPRVQVTIPYSETVIN